MSVAQLGSKQADFMSNQTNSNAVVEHKSPDGYKEPTKLPPQQHSDVITTPQNITSNDAVQANATTKVSGMLPEHVVSQIQKEGSKEEHIGPKLNESTTTFDVNHNHINVGINKNNNTAGATEPGSDDKVHHTLAKVVGLSSRGGPTNDATAGKSNQTDQSQSDKVPATTDSSGRPHEALKSARLPVVNKGLVGRLVSDQTAATTTSNSTQNSTQSWFPSLLALSLQPPLAIASILPTKTIDGKSASNSTLESIVSSYLSGEDTLNYALVFAVPLIGCLIMIAIMLMISRFCHKLGEKFRRNKTGPNQQQNPSGKFWGFCVGSPFATNKSSVINNDNDWGGVQIMDDSNSKDKNADIGNNINKNSRRSTVQFNSSSAMKQHAGSVKRIPQWHTILDERKSIDHSLQRSKTWNKNKLTKQKIVDLDDARLSMSFGQLRYGLSYDFDKSQLTIRIFEARNLPAMDLGGSSDPYVKIYLVTNFGSTTSVIDTKTDNCLYKTRTHKRTLNPEFNDTFKYDIGYADLCQKTLVLSVFDYDCFSKHDEIGQVDIPLVSLDYSTTIEAWADLQRHESVGEELGDISLSLRYVPTSGKLTVVVQEARKLKKMDMAGLSDPYVKLALMCNGVRLKKRKTSIKKCTLNPRYNESFSFEVPFEQVQNVQLVVTVIDYDRIGTSEPIGKIVLGCANTTGETERCHWMNMLASPRRPIVQWHSLKSLSNVESHNAGLDNVSTMTGSTLISKDCSSLSDSIGSH